MSAESQESSNDGTLKFGGKKSVFQDGCSVNEEEYTDVSQRNVQKPKYQREKSFLKSGKVGTKCVPISLVKKSSTRN